MQGSVCLTRIDPDGSRVLFDEVQLPTLVTLELRPWQMCCVEQQPVQRPSIARQIAVAL